MFTKAKWIRPVETVDVLALPVTDARRLASLAATQFDETADHPPTSRSQRHKQPVSHELARRNVVTEMLAEAGAKSPDTLANTVFSFAGSLAFAARKNSTITALDLERALVVALSTPTDDPLWSHYEDLLAVGSRGAVLEDPDRSRNPALAATLAADWGRQVTVAQRALRHDLARLVGEPT